MRSKASVPVRSLSNLAGTVVISDPRFGHARAVKDCTASEISDPFGTVVIDGGITSRKFPQRIRNLQKLCFAFD